MRRAKKVIQTIMVSTVLASVHFTGCAAVEDFGCPDSAPACGANVLDVEQGSLGEFPLKAVAIS